MKALMEKEIAKEIGLSQWTIRRLRLDYGLPVTKVGRRYLYRLDSVVEWFSLQEKKVGRGGELI